MAERVDVVVVGAGLAGLSAALRLSARGTSVIVLEAAEEVGGRTRSRLVDGHVVDLGGEWLGPRHQNLRRLVRELGLHLEPARLLGSPVRWRGGDTDHVSPLPTREVTADALRTGLAIDRLARDIDPRRPWQSPAAAELDLMSAADWASGLSIGDSTYRYLTGVVEMLSSTPVRRLSLLHLLWWIRRGGGLASTLRTTFHSRIREGAQAVAQRAAERLCGRVVLGSRVTHVGQGGDVEVRCLDGRTFLGRCAVVTGGLGGVARAATFDPLLPAALRALGEIRVDPGVKVAGVLPADAVPRHRVVLGGAPVGRSWRYGRRVAGFALCEPSATDDALRADLAEAYHVHAEHLRGFVVRRWDENDPAGGSDVGFAPGQLTRLGPDLAAPHGLVLFAGAERSSWPNSMEGAVQSGQRAAYQALALLGRAS